MKRVQSNIVNIGFTIMNKQQDVKDGQGRLRKVKSQGVELTHAVVNGNTAGATLRTINGGPMKIMFKRRPRSGTDTDIHECSIFHHVAQNTAPSSFDHGGVTLIKPAETHTARHRRHC